MKTKMILLAAILGLQINLSAANTKTPVNTISNISPDFFLSLIPTTPREASFEEMTAFAVINFSDLAPVMPVEADFSDVVPESAINLSALASVLPLEADFSDVVPEHALDLSTLTPVLPLETGFSDTIEDPNPASSIQHPVSSFQLTDLTPFTPVTPKVADFEDAF